MSHGICPGCRQPEDDCECIAYEIEKEVSHPSHYTTHPSGIECIQVTEHMGFLDGNAMKYLWRHKDKGNPLQDLKKARWYIDRLIERYENER